MDRPDHVTPSPSDPRLAAWRAFLVAHGHVTRRLDDDLRAEHGMSLAEYEALLHIAEAPGRRLRMSQLADRVVLSRSGVTRLIDRLVADGFVERGSCREDARGAEAILTPAGLDHLRSAARTHLRGIEQFFLSTVSAEDLDVLQRVLDQVADHAATRVGPAPESCTVDETDAGPADEPGSASTALAPVPAGSRPAD